MTRLGIIFFFARMIASASRISASMAALVVLSSLGLFGAGASPARAHEISAAIADMSEENGALRLSIVLNLEAVLAGIDQTAYKETSAAPQASRYDALRALRPDQLADAFRADWPQIAPKIHLRAGGEEDLPLELIAVEVQTGVPPELARDSTITLRAELPEGAEAVTFGWDAFMGEVVIRQVGVEDPYTKFLDLDEVSDPIPLAGSGAVTGLSAFISYIPIGYKHILPLGLDHILFVLGLFLLSTHWRPLLWQVSAFTVAHTITLALAASGKVSVPASVVEPLIAASITFVAVENIFTTKLHRWRTVLVFGFGLLHGLGFASVLTEWGLPSGAFVPALLGFNVGVELGQLTVIAAAYATVGYWFGDKSWYHRVITVPASAAIALIGTWWVVERVFL